MFLNILLVAAFTCHQIGTEGRALMTNESYWQQREALLQEDYSTMLGEWKHFDIE